MKELDRCLSIRKKIKDIDDKIDTLRAAILSPKNQVITGMPRSGNTENAIERYMLKVEKLEARKQKLLSSQTKLWRRALWKMESAQLTIPEKEMLYFRFVEGLSWKKVTYKLNSKYYGWNESKVFRIYRGLKAFL